MKPLQVLKNCKLFAGLDEEQLNKLASLATEQEYTAGATIFREGGRADEFLIVEDGKVALQMTLPEESGQSAKRVTVEIIAPNEILGWSSIVEPHVYTLTAICLQRVKVLSIDAVQLRTLLKNEHQINYEILKGLVAVIAERLALTRHVLVSERLLAPRA